MMAYEVSEILFLLPERQDSRTPINMSSLIYRAGVHEITSQEFDIHEKMEEVIFLYFYDQATTSEDFVSSLSI
jgi:hypothetical protein